MELDIKDKRLIYLLSKDASQPISQIAKEAKLTRDIVTYRIKRLQEAKVIKSFKVAIDYKRLGYAEYDLHFKLENADPKTLQSIIDAFTNNGFVTWVGLCFGEYELRISILAKDNDHLNEVLSSIYGSIGKHIKTTEISPIVGKFKLQATQIAQEWWPELQVKEKQQATKADATSSTPVALDKIDHALLMLLGSNPLASAVELSRPLKLTPEAIRYRIKNLKKQGIIKGTYAIVDGNNLGYIWCTFLFKFSQMSKEQEATFESYIQSLKKVSTAARLIGRWDVSLTVYAKSVREAQALLFDFKNRFTNVTDYASFMILETYKYPAVAKGVFE